jgi:hypothetical protein
MSDNDSMTDGADKNPNTKAGMGRRNLILGLILAAASLIMYASIFWRLSVNPLG